MPKVSSFLSEDTIQNLEKLCKSSGKSLSKVISELVETGYQIKRDQETQKANPQSEKIFKLALKHSEYLLRILNIESEILRKLYNEPSRCTKKTVDLKLSEIKVHAKEHIKSKLIHKK